MASDTTSDMQTLIDLAAGVFQRVDRQKQNIDDALAGLSALDRTVRANLTVLPGQVSGQVESQLEGLVDRAADRIVRKQEAAIASLDAATQRFQTATRFTWLRLVAFGAIAVLIGSGAASVVAHFAVKQALETRMAAASRVYDCKAGEGTVYPCALVVSRPADGDCFDRNGATYCRLATR